MVFAFNALAAEPTTRPFAIHVVDDQTGRGVPLVELRTVSEVRCYTDSAGYVAIDDPAMLGRKVFFHVSSHGYEFPPDGFGYHGRAIELKPGGEETLKIKRLNIAERLYRVTGEGIFRDSVVLGKPTPIAEPLLNGQVTGQDSVLGVVYRGKIWWFWGDTGRQSYPMGHFSTAGATSDLPGSGGLDPALGVNLHYFTDANGFSRPMVSPSGAELHWIDGVTTLKDDKGQERLIASVAKLKSMSQVNARELIVMNDEKAMFDTVLPLDKTSPLRLCGHPFRHTIDGVEYIYCGEPFPNVRVRADWKSVTDPTAYEGYVPQSRGEDGKLAWEWKKEATPLGIDEQERRIRSGEIKAEESPQRLRDVESKKFIRAHYGSVRYNAFRKKWVMIFVEQGSKTSFLGEVWYAEAEAPEGAWNWARKILTHDRYSFYNPVQHEFFDQEGGRIIYFQGTYATTFSREGEPTPRYDYNMMMYRLDLSDPRLRI